MTADRIGSLTAADVKTAGGTVIPFDLRTTNDGVDKPIVSAGPFTVDAECRLSGNGVQNVYTVFATTSENDAAAEGTDIFGTSHHDNDFDIGEKFQINLHQESGTPPDPSGPFPIEATLWSRSGTSLTLHGAIGGHLFSNNQSDRVQCTFAGYAVVGP